MIKLSHEVEIGKIPEIFRDGSSGEILQKHMMDSQLFAKRFREISSRSMLNPRRIGGDEDLHRSMCMDFLCIYYVNQYSSTKVNWSNFARLQNYH